MYHPRIRDRLGRRSYSTEGHVAITAGTGGALLERALSAQGLTRRVVLELPGFLGLSAIISGTDLLAMLPRHIGTTLARASGLAMWSCPVPVEGFEVAQYWHARYDQEPGNRWLRGVVTDLFSSAT